MYLFLNHRRNEEKLIHSSFNYQRDEQKRIYMSLNYRRNEDKPKYLLHNTQKTVRQKIFTPGISELSVQNIWDSGEMLSKDRCKTTSGFFVVPLLSQLWEEKNYCERRNELSSWRPVPLPNGHTHLCLFKLGYDVHALLSSVMYILSGKKITAVYPMSQLLGSLKKNTTLEYSTVQEWSRRETVDVKRVLLTI